MRNNEFHRFLIDSFDGGRSSRELRLSADEVTLIKKDYPEASFKPLSHTQSGKNWYEVKLYKKKIKKPSHM